MDFRRIHRNRIGDKKRRLESPLVQKIFENSLGKLKRSVNRKMRHYEHLKVLRREIRNREETAMNGR